MLRSLFLLLLLANGVYFVWSHSLITGWGPAPVSEPQRLQQQINPEKLQLVPRRGPASAPSSDAGGGQAMGAAVAAASSPVPAPAASSARHVECLLAGVFDNAQAAVLRQALSVRLPASAWGLEPVVITPARWIVYMGRYPNAEWVDRKKAELRALRVRYDAPSNPALEPGLALGRFDTEEAATQELGSLTKRGVRTAHVVVERNEVRGAQLRLPAVDDALRAGLDELKVALAGKPLKPCAA